MIAVWKILLNIFQTSSNNSTALRMQNRGVVSIFGAGYPGCDLAAWVPNAPKMEGESKGGYFPSWHTTFAESLEQYTTTDTGANGIAKYLENHGIRKIQRQNGKNPLFDAHLIRLILRNPVYCGKIAYGRRRTEKVHGTRNDYRLVEQENYLLVDGIHEGLVSEEVWQTAQVMQQGGFAGAGRAHDGGKLALFHRQVHAVQGPDLRVAGTVYFPQAAGLQYSHTIYLHSVKSALPFGSTDFNTKIFPDPF